MNAQQKLVLCIYPAFGAVVEICKERPRTHFQTITLWRLDSGELLGIDPKTYFIWSLHVNRKQVIFGFYWASFPVQGQCWLGVVLVSVLSYFSDNAVQVWSLF